MPRRHNPRRNDGLRPRTEARLDAAKLLHKLRRGAAGTTTKTTGAP